MAKNDQWEILDPAGYTALKGNRSAPPRASQAAVGQVRDRWAGKTAGEIDPDLAARVLRADGDLSLQMAVAKKVLKHDHVYSTLRNYILAVMRHGWNVVPFDDKSRAAKKQAEKSKGFFLSIPKFRKLVTYLMFGEYYPLIGAGLLWNREYALDGWLRVNPVRWKWNHEKNRLQLLTNGNAYQGEPLVDRRAYAIHLDEFEPGAGPLDWGKWQKVLWLWMFMTYSWAAWVRFAEQYGNPYIWAFFAKSEEEQTVFDAVMAMDANARGVFPLGTEIKLQEAQRYGTTNLYQTIVKEARNGITVLFNGHSLGTNAESGSGMMASGAADDVSLRNQQAGAINISETVQTDVHIPWCEWHYGEKAVEAGEIPIWTIDAVPAEDKQKKAQIFLTVNQGIAAAGRTIAPDQWEEEFEIRTVPIASGGTPAEPQDEGSDERAARRSASRAVPFTVAAGRLRVAVNAVAAAKAKKPAIATEADIVGVGRQIIANAAREFSEKVTAAIAAVPANPDGTVSPEVANIIWESYAALDVTRLASGLHDTTVAAHLSGQGDVVEEAQP